MILSYQCLVLLGLLDNFLCELSSHFIHLVLNQLNFLVAFSLIVFFLKLKFVLHFDLLDKKLFFHLLHLLLQRVLLLFLVQIDKMQLLFTHHLILLFLKLKWLFQLLVFILETFTFLESFHVLILLLSNCLLKLKNVLLSTLDGFLKVFNWFLWILESVSKVLLDGLIITLFHSETQSW